MCRLQSGVPPLSHIRPSRTPFGWYATAGMGSPKRGYPLGPFTISSRFVCDRNRRPGRRRPGRRKGAAIRRVGLHAQAPAAPVLASRIARHPQRRSHVRGTPVRCRDGGPDSGQPSRAGRSACGRWSWQQDRPIGDLGGSGRYRFLRQSFPTFAGCPGSPGSPVCTCGRIEQAAVLELAFAGGRAQGLLSRMLLTSGS